MNQYINHLTDADVLEICRRTTGGKDMTECFNYANGSNSSRTDINVVIEDGSEINIADDYTISFKNLYSVDNVFNEEEFIKFMYEKFGEEYLVEFANTKFDIHGKREEIARLMKELQLLEVQAKNFFVEKKLQYSSEKKIVNHVNPEEADVEERICQMFARMDEHFKGLRPVTSLTREEVNLLNWTLDYTRKVRNSLGMDRDEKAYQLEKDLHWLRGVMLRHNLEKITR